jgi:hypothetical protein
MAKKNIDKFKDLTFEKNDLQFNDHRKQLMGYIEGSFTRAEIVSKLQELSDGLKAKGRNGYIGVSIHYGYPDAWLPCIYTKYGDNVKIFDPEDSDTTEGYKDIDALCFMIIEGKDENESMFQRAKKKK